MNGSKKTDPILTHTHTHTHTLTSVSIFYNYLSPSLMILTNVFATRLSTSLIKDKVSSAARGSNVGKTWGWTVWRTALWAIPTLAGLVGIDNVSEQTVF